MNEYKLHVSVGNTKLGRIPSVSLPPLVTCIENPPCAALCYARKSYEWYARSTCKPAWDENLEFYQGHSKGYFDAIIHHLSRRKRKPDGNYFRWHVGGDIPDEAYLDGMYKVAYLLPGWNFLAYSRRSYAWTSERRISGSGVPGNLRVLRSLWLTDEAQDSQHPFFKVLPKGATQEGLTMCPGSCATCKRCWHVQPGEGTGIHLH